MSVHFRPVFGNDGFDEHAQPNPWLMVPEHGSNSVILERSAGLTLRVQNTEIATFETLPGPGASRVRVNGQRIGQTVLELVDSGDGVVVRLDVSVLRKKKVDISFHFVSDRAGHATIRMGPTTRFPSLRGPESERTRPHNARSMIDCVQLCLRELNDIFEPQVNLFFLLRNFGQAHIDRDLQDRVYAASSNLRNTLRRLKDPGARINVFFLWDVMFPRMHITGYALVPDGICLVDDEDSVGLTVAHEVGHILLRPLMFHHFMGEARSHMLMHESGAHHARFIPKRQAIHMNQQA